MQAGLVYIFGRVLENLLDIVSVLVQPLAELAFGCEDELLVHVVAIEINIRLRKSPGHQQDDPVLEAHRQLDLVLGSADDARTALDDDVVAGLHAVIELVKGMLELAHQDGVPRAQLVPDVGEDAGEIGYGSELVGGSEAGLGLGGGWQHLII